MSEWIKCSKRLPSIRAGDNDISDDVLVFMRDQDGQIVHFVGFYSHEDEEWYEIDGEPSDWLGEPTHWMPLPTPPRD